MNHQMKLNHKLRLNLSHHHVKNDIIIANRHLVDLGDFSFALAHVMKTSKQSNEYYLLENQTI